MSISYLFSFSHAQNVGINTTGNPPVASAGLDIDFSNKGVLIPRVTLSNNTDVTTIPSPAISLMVYHNGSVGFPTAGFYYWNGTNWINFGAQGPAGASGLVYNSDYYYTSASVINATGNNNTWGDAYSLPNNIPAGTWMISVCGTMSYSGTGGSGDLRILVGGTEVFLRENYTGNTYEYSRFVIVTVATSSVVKVQHRRDLTGNITHTRPAMVAFKLD